MRSYFERQENIYDALVLGKAAGKTGLNEKEIIEFVGNSDAKPTAQDILNSDWKAKNKY